MRRALLVFGLPGSGKGTHTKKLCRAIEERGQTCRVIEVGTGLRSIAAGQHFSSVAKSLAEVMDAGKLVPEIFPLYVLAKEMIECPSPLADPDVIILDGFGRQLRELRMGLRLLEMLRYQVDAILLDITAGEARKRLLGRGREDDTPEAIDRRIFAYQKSTRVSLRHLCRSGMLRTVDSMGTIEETHKKLLNCLGFELLIDQAKNKTS